MTRFAMLIAVVAICLTTATANAQVAQVVYYGPAPVAVAPQATTVYYSPAPTTAYYGPAATTAYYAPAPRTAYYAPAPGTAYYAPAPVTAYYAPAPVVAAPVPVTTTYYRPLIGGTITRTRYVYPARTYVAPTVTYYQPY